MGSLNFSRIDNGQLQFNINETTLTNTKKFLDSSKHSDVDNASFDMTIYAINYNYLIIKGGMAGLAYST